MSASFSFSNDENASLSDTHHQSTLVLGDIEKTMKSDEIGEGLTLPNGAIRIQYQSFTIVTYPDGTFHGERKTNVSRS